MALSPGQLARDAGAFRDPNFQDAIQAREQSSLATGGLSPAVQAARINAERDQARFNAQATRDQQLQEFERQKLQLIQAGLDERAAEQIASANLRAALTGSGQLGQQVANVDRFNRGTFSGIDPAVQEALDQQQALIEQLQSGTGGGDTSPGASFTEGQIIQSPDGRQGRVVRDPATGELFVEVQ